MKTLFVAVVALFVTATTISATGTGLSAPIPSEDGYTSNFQDTTKKKDKKKKDTTKKDTTFVQYHH